MRSTALLVLCLTLLAPLASAAELVPPLPEDQTAREALLAPLRSVERSGSATLLRPQRGGTWTAEERALPRSVASRGARSETPRPQFVYPQRAEGVTSLLEGEASTQAKFLTCPPLSSFEGPGDTGRALPRPSIAAGPEHVGVAVDALVRFYDKCGTLAWEWDIAADYNGVTQWAQEPVLLYDEWDERWILLVNVLTQDTVLTSQVYVWVSATSSPLWGWYLYQYDGGVSGGQATGRIPADLDVGVDPNNLYISSNEAHPVTRVVDRSRLRVVDKADVYAGFPASQLVFSFLNHQDGSPMLYLKPAKMHGFRGDFWLACAKPEGSDRITLLQILPDFTLGYVGQLHWMTVPAYAPSASGLPQSDGTYLDAGDSRCTSAVYQDGELWLTQAVEVNALGSLYPGISLHRIETEPTPTPDFVRFTNLNGGFAHPSLDIDREGRNLLARTYGSTTQLPRTVLSQQEPGLSGLNCEVAVSTAAYSSSLATGTAGDPFPWGPSHAVTIDPTDGNTFWVAALYSDGNGWRTRVTSTTHDTPGQLQVLEFSDPFVGGFEGGTFSPTVFQYHLGNPGSTAVPFFVQGAPPLIAVTPTSGQVLPGQVVPIEFRVDETLAATFGPGVGDYELTFGECVTGNEIYRTVQVAVVEDGNCEGASLDMGPGDAPHAAQGMNAGTERGLYFTALEGAQVCAVGFEARLSQPQLLTARLYQATGTTRGALIAENSWMAGRTGQVVHHIPLSADLDPCAEYDLSIEFGGTGIYPIWGESLISLPYDAAARIRVRDGHDGGDASWSNIPHLWLVTNAGNGTQVSELATGQAVGNAAVAGEDRGTYISALESAKVSTVGVEGSFPVGSELRARVFAATGTTRGALLAEGTLVVTASGSTYHDVPLSVQLLAGQDYDVNVVLPGSGTLVFEDETQISLPFLVDDAFVVRDGEISSSPANSALPRLRLGWTLGVGGAAEDLRAPSWMGPTPQTSTQPSTKRGLFVAATASRQLRGLGWMADVPAGQPITLRVFDAVNNTRGAMLAQVTQPSPAPGMRWHDLPVALSLVGGAEYDFEFSWSGVNAWPYWDQGTTLPFLTESFKVQDAESGGNNSFSEVIQMRALLCDPSGQNVAVSVPEESVVGLRLMPVSPNPVRGASTISFVASEAKYALELFDVRGRRVRTVDIGRGDGGPRTVGFDARELASGVYFLRLSAGGARVDRKVVVLR